MALAVATLLAAPLLCGNAFGAWLRVVAPAVAHTCACGMKAGTCGCPDCERMERAHLEERAPKPYRVLRSQCDDDGEMVPTGTVPPSTIASPAFVVAPSESRLIASRPLTSPESRERREPAKPPPRSSLA